jgi:hypothetical protein
MRHVDFAFKANPNLDPYFETVPSSMKISGF